MPSFIDGQTRHGYVAPLAGIHDGLSFDYRAALIEECSALHDGPPNQFDLRTARLLAKKLQSWDLIDKSKSPPECPQINPDNILKHMQPKLYTDVVGIVTGSRASDSGEPHDAEAEVKN